MPVVAQNFLRTFQLSHVINIVIYLQFVLLMKVKFDKEFNLDTSPWLTAYIRNSPSSG
jgi:hypothetical protein